MHLLLVHNYYQQPGGADDVFAREQALLEAHGHRTTAYIRRNDEIHQYSLLDKASLALRTTWAWDSHAEFKRLLGQAKPDLVHVHNTFPLISPSLYYACSEADVPVVQSLHNARLLCAGGNYYRDGRICMDCLGKKVPWPGTVHGCYHNSRAQTAVVSAMLAVHNLSGRGVTVDLGPQAEQQGQSPAEVFSAAAHREQVDEKLEKVRLAPYSYRWVRLRSSPGP